MHDLPAPFVAHTEGSIADRGDAHRAVKSIRRHGSLALGRNGQNLPCTGLCAQHVAGGGEAHPINSLRPSSRISLVTVAGEYRAIAPGGRHVQVPVRGAGETPHEARDTFVGEYCRSLCAAVRSQDRDLKPVRDVHLIAEDTEAVRREKPRVDEAARLVAVALTAAPSVYRRSAVAAGHLGRPPQRPARRNWSTKILSSKIPIPFAPESPSAMTSIRPRSRAETRAFMHSVAYNTPPESNARSSGETIPSPRGEDRPAAGIDIDTADLAAEGGDHVKPVVQSEPQAVRTGEPARATDALQSPSVGELQLRRLRHLERDGRPALDGPAAG